MECTLNRRFSVLHSVGSFLHLCFLALFSRQHAPKKSKTPSKYAAAAAAAMTDDTEMHGEAFDGATEITPTAVIAKITKFLSEKSSMSLGAIVEGIEEIRADIRRLCSDRTNLEQYILENDHDRVTVSTFYAMIGQYAPHLAITRPDQSLVAHRAGGIVVVMVDHSMSMNDRATGGSYRGRRGGRFGNQVRDPVIAMARELVTRGYTVFITPFGCEEYDQYGLLSVEEYANSTDPNILTADGAGTLIQSSLERTKDLGPHVIAIISDGQLCCRCRRDGRRGQATLREEDMASYPQLPTCTGMIFMWTPWTPVGTSEQQPRLLSGLLVNAAMTYVRSFDELKNEIVQRSVSNIEPFYMAIGGYQILKSLTSPTNMIRLVRSLIKRAETVPRELSNFCLLLREIFEVLRQSAQTEIRTCLVRGEEFRNIMSVIKPLTNMFDGHRDNATCVEMNCYLTELFEIIQTAYDAALSGPNSDELRAAWTDAMTVDESEMIYDAIDDGQWGAVIGYLDLPIIDHAELYEVL